MVHELKDSLPWSIPTDGRGFNVYEWWGKNDSGEYEFVFASTAEVGVEFANGDSMVVIRRTWAPCGDPQIVNGNLP